MAAGRGGDDAYGVFVDGDALVIAVSDGAGSRPGTSMFGSHVACSAIVTVASRRPIARSARDLQAQIRSWFEFAVSELEAEAMTREWTVGALSCTLAVAILRKDLAVVGQVGDGVIVSRRRGEVSAHVPEHKGDYANETSFLRNPEALTRDLRLEVLAGVDAISVSTDGLRYKILDLGEGAPFEPFFDALWDRLAESTIPEEQLAAFLDGIIDDQTGDDKTLVTAVLVPASASRTADPVRRELRSADPGTIE